MGVLAAMVTKAHDELDAVHPGIDESVTITSALAWVRRPSASAPLRASVTRAPR